MALLPGGISTEEGHGAPRAKGCIRSWKPWTWRTRMGVISGAGNIASLEGIGAAELQALVGWIINAGNIASAAAFGTAHLTEPGMYDWLLVDNADRLYPWASYCGIPGGIPNRTTIYTSLGLAGQVPSYAQSVTAAQVNAAIAACPADQVVYLYPGTYNLAGFTFNRKNGITLRGAGPGKTTLKPTSGGVGFIQSGYPDFSQTGAAMESGYTRGSTAIVMSSTPHTNIRAGNLILIAETTDENKWGTDIGVYMGVNCTGGYAWDLGSNTSKFTYVARVESVVGNTVNLAAPIPVSFTASNTPLVHPQTSSAAPCSMCGIENMTLDGSLVGTTGAYSAVSLRNADRFWTKDVEIKNFGGGDLGFIFANGTFQCEFRRCYIHDCQGFPTQADGQGIGLEWSTSNALVVDCIAYRVASLIQTAGSNVEAVLYNYCDTISRDGYLANLWVNSAISSHGPEPIMGMYEGNVFNRFMHDGYHGSAAYSMVYRNHINGLDGLGCTGQRKLLTLLRGSYYISVIGNVLGDASWTLTEYDGGVGSGDIVAYALGFPSVWDWDSGEDSEWPDYDNSIPDPNVLATLLRNANYDYFHHAVVYAAGLGHDIPASLFYSSKPSWFGSLEWPPIGPDVGGLITDIPAQRRWKTYLVSGNIDDLFTDVS